MTHNELRALMTSGTHPRLKVGKLSVPVIINDVRQVFGRVDANVTPEHGDGSEWVSLDRLTGLN